MVAGLFIKPAPESLTRMVAVIMDIERSLKNVERAIRVRYTSDGTTTNTVTVGCSCRDERLVESCEHTSFLDSDSRVRKVIDEILMMPVMGPKPEEHVGVLAVSPVSGERYRYWDWHNRKIRSKVLSGIVILVEKLPTKRGIQT